MQKYLFILLICFVSIACEDVIDVELEEGKSQLVVDGFITNDSSLQTIRLTLSAPYFLNAPTPAVTDATVEIYGPNGEVYSFVSQQNGNYVYDPGSLGAIDSTLFPYELKIVFQNKAYSCVQKLPPVPTIDSMNQRFEEGTSFNEAGYFTEFFARDFAGREDWYWVRAYKNGESIANDPTEFILSKDAGFFGAEADGFQFILPIRSAITAIDDPFAVGDTSTVELLSITEEVYEFIEQATIQANNGGLFSTPPANIKSNIKDASGNPQNEVLGVFSLSSISKQSLIIKEE